MKSVRLTRKLADQIDGVDLTRLQPGDTAVLPDYQAELLIAEGWARPRDEAKGAASSPKNPRSERNNGTRLA